MILGNTKTQKNGKLQKESKISKKIKADILKSQQQKRYTTLCAFFDIILITIYNANIVILQN